MLQYFRTGRCKPQVDLLVSYDAGYSSFSYRLFIISKTLQYIRFSYAKQPGLTLFYESDELYALLHFLQDFMQVITAGELHDVDAEIRLH
jgi:hypothetical protein